MAVLKSQFLLDNVKNKDWTEMLNLLLEERIFKHSNIIQLKWLELMVKNDRFEDILTASCSKSKIGTSFLNSHSRNLSFFSRKNRTKELQKLSSNNPLVSNWKSHIYEKIRNKNFSFWPKYKDCKWVLETLGLSKTFGSHDVRLTYWSLMELKANNLEYPEDLLEKIESLLPKDFYSLSPFRHRRCERVVNGFFSRRPGDYSFNVLDKIARKDDPKLLKMILPKVLENHPTLEFEGLQVHLVDSLLQRNAHRCLMYWCSNNPEHLLSIFQSRYVFFDEQQRNVVVSKRIDNGFPLDAWMHRFLVWSIEENLNTFKAFEYSVTACLQKKGCQKTVAEWEEKFSVVNMLFQKQKKLDSWYLHEDRYLIQVLLERLISWVTKTLDLPKIQLASCFMEPTKFA